MRSISRRRAKAWSRPTNGSWSSAVVSIKHPSTLPAESHRSLDALAGQFDGRFLRHSAAAAFQHRSITLWQAQFPSFEQPAHDLSSPVLGQRGHEFYFLRGDDR